MLNPFVGFGVAFLVVVWLLRAGLRSRHSNWPRNETILASVLSAAALTANRLVPREFMYEFDPWMLLVADPLALVALFLWVYILGRTVRRLWQGDTGLAA